MTSKPASYPSRDPRPYRTDAQFAAIDSMARSIRGRAQLTDWQLRRYEDRQARASA